MLITSYVSLCKEDFVWDRTSQTEYQCIKFQLSPPVLATKLQVLLEYVWHLVTISMKGLRNQLRQTPFIEGLNPVATYKVSPFQVNGFTEGQSNVFIFNKEMLEDPCRCIILRNFAHWMARLKRFLEMHFSSKSWQTGFYCKQIR